MARNATPPGATSRGASRTVMIAKLKPPPTRSGQVAFLVSCGGMLAITAVFMLMCAGLNVGVPLLLTPGIAILSMATAVVCATPYFFVILWLDRNEREPLHLVLSAWLWGAIMATGMSIVFNDTFSVVSLAVTGSEAAAAQLTASLSAPFIEELTKALALVVIYVFFHRDFDNVLDGVFYGAMVGLGFATFENFMYYTSQETVAGVLVLTLLRGILTSAGTHICFTALTGAGFGVFRVMRRGVLRWFIPPAALMLAMVVHFSWNTFAQCFIGMGQSELSQLFVWVPVAVLFLQIPFVLLVLLVSAISLRHERLMIELYLSTEAPPVLQVGELARLVPARRRSWHMLKLLASFQWQAWWITRQRNHHLIRLAFEKWHMDQEAAGGTPLEGRAHALEVLALRKKLTALQVPRGAPAAT